MLAIKGEWWLAVTDLLMGQYSADAVGALLWSRLADSNR